MTAYVASMESVDQVHHPTPVLILNRTFNSNYRRRHVGAERGGREHRGLAQQRVGVGAARGAIKRPTRQKNASD